MYRKEVPPEEAPASEQQPQQYEQYEHQHEPQLDSYSPREPGMPSQNEHLKAHPSGSHVGDNHGRPGRRPVYAKSGAQVVEMVMHSRPSMSLLAPTAGSKSHLQHTSTGAGAGPGAHIHASSTRPPQPSRMIIVRQTSAIDS